MPQQQGYTLQDIIREEATRLGVPPELALAIAEQESSFRPDVIGPEIMKGPAKGQRAMGLFQLIPETAKRMGVVDPMDPIQNIQGGLKYIRELLDQHQGDGAKVIATYGGVVDDTNYVPSVVAKIGQYSGGAPSSADPLASIRGLSGSASGTAANVSATGTASRSLRHRATTEVGNTLLGALPTMSQVAPMSGAMIGGARGAMMGAPAGPLGAAIGGVAGAGLGAFGGEGINLLTEQVKSLFGSGQGPSASEAVSRLGQSANAGMIGEVLGQAGFQVLTPVMRRLAAPLRNKQATHANEALTEFPASEGAVLPSEISESRLLNIAENIAEGSILGGSRIAQVKQTRETLAEQKVLDVLNTLGERVGKRTSGRGVHAARATAIKQFRANEKAAYGAFEEVASDVPVATPSLNKYLAELRGETQTALLPNAGYEAANRISKMAIESGPEVQKLMLGGVDVAKNLSEKTLALIPQASKPSTTVTATQFQQTISDLGKLVRGLERSAKMDPSRYNAQLGTAKRVLALAKEDMRTSLAVKPVAAEAYEAATQLSYEGNKRLFNDTMLDLAKKAPEKIVGRLMRPDNSSAIDLVREAVGPEALGPIQREAADLLIQRKVGSNTISWTATAKKIQSMGEETLSAMFPDGQAKRIQDFAQLMVKLQNRPAQGIGRVGILLTQWGAVAGVMSGTFTAPSMGVLLTPPILSRIMASPTGLKWLTIGLKNPAGSPQAVRAGAQLMTFIQAETDAVSSLPSFDQEPVEGGRTYFSGLQSGTPDASTRPK